MTLSWRLDCYGAPCSVVNIIVIVLSRHCVTAYVCVYHTCSPRNDTCGTTHKDTAWVAQIDASVVGEKDSQEYKAAFNLAVTMSWVRVARPTNPWQPVCMKHHTMRTLCI